MIFDFSNSIIAHRGASAYAPENTMSAFVKAAQLGAKWVEFDVVLAKCGTPIIFHDELLDRTTNAHNMIDTLTYAELRTLDAGRWFHPRFSGERVPTLHDALVFLYSMGMSANVEIKPIPGKEELTVKRTLEVMTESPFGSINPRILYSSFSITSLEYLRHYSPQAPIGLLLERWEPNWEVACDTLNCVSINVDEMIVTSKAAQRVKQKDKYLLCYTVNDPARAQTLFEMGVDAVFSDYPDLIERELAYGS